MATDPNMLDLLGARPPSQGGPAPGHLARGGQHPHHAGEHGQESIEARRAHLTKVVAQLEHELAVNRQRLATLGR